MSAPHRSVFYRPDALPAAQPTASNHRRHYVGYLHLFYLLVVVDCCLKVTYSADGVHLDLVNQVRQDGGLVVAHGSVAFDRCSDTVSAHPIMFTAPTAASLELPGSWWSATGTAGSSVQLTLTTNEPDGLIFHVLLSDADGGEHSGFLALELFEGAWQGLNLSRRRSLGGNRTVYR